MTNAYTELLAGLDAGQLDGVLALGSRRLVPGGSELFHLGQDAECLFLVESGRVRLTMPIALRGREEQVLVEEITVGQVLGWSAVVPPYRFTLTGMAPVDTEVLALPRESLRKHFAEHPDVGYAVSQNLAASIGRRLQLFQAMWLRQVQRLVESRCA